MTPPSNVTKDQMIELVTRVRLNGFDVMGGRMPGKEQHIATCDAILSHLRAPPEMRPHWVEWKPGDELPRAGMYRCAIMFPDGEHQGRDLSETQFLDWCDTNLRYWSTPLPPPFSHSPPASGEVG